MINTIAQLLEEFKEQELKVLKEYHMVNHPTIIGSMYENLTKEILNKALFTNIDLRVKAGKIKNEKTGQLSPEIDCMLVIGEGDHIPYTDKYIYESRKVIMIVEVKKNLFSREIRDSYNIMFNVLKSIDYESRSHEHHHGMHESAYKIMCRDNLYTTQELKLLPIEKQMIYNSIALESYLPLRVVWGYDGFKSEFAFREAFFTYMESYITDKGYKRGISPVKLPSLIICNNYSLVKNNGIPFAKPIRKDNYWDVYGSSNENPVYYFVEMIWTRLHYMFGISASIFGDDMRADVLHSYLSCIPRYIEKDDLMGWEWRYHAFRESDLNVPLNHGEWEPTFLSDTQYTILLNVYKNGELLVDEKFSAFISNEGYSLNEFLDSLVETGFFTIRDNVIIPLYDELMTGIAFDGRNFAGDNSTGHVSKWLDRLSKNSI